MKKSLQELLEARNEVSAKIDQLLAGDSLTDEQKAEVTRLEGEFEQLTTDIAAAEQRAAEEQQIRQRQAARQQQLSAGRGRQVTPPPAGQTRSTVNRQHDNVLDDPARGFRTPREFVLAVMNAGSNLGFDERLAPLRSAAGSDEHGTHTNPHGGFLVPAAFSPNLLSLTPEDDPFGSRVQQVPMTAQIVYINARVDKDHRESVSGGLTVTRRAETTKGEASRMRLEQISLQAHSLFGLACATEEILQDSPISFAALLASGFGEEFRSRMTQERINGTGAGEFLGFMNSKALITVDKEDGQANNTIDFINIVQMRSRVWGYGNSIWLANHDTLPQLMLLNQVLGTSGVPVWQPSAREDHPDLLLGRPLVFTEYVPALGSKGDICCVNPTQYLEGTLQGLRQDESVHVRFEQNERVFRFTMRNAGAPWWTETLTPKHSTKTMSPFVTLGDRKP